MHKLSDVKILEDTFEIFGGNFGDGKKRIALMLTYTAENEDDRVEFVCETTNHETKIFDTYEELKEFCRKEYTAHKREELDSGKVVELGVGYTNYHKKSTYNFTIYNAKKENDKYVLSAINIDVGGHLIDIVVVNTYNSFDELYDNALKLIEE